MEVVMIDRLRRWSLSLLLAFVGAPTVAVAQASPADSAMKAAREILWAMVRKDYLWVSKRTDIAELRRTRLSFDSLLARDSSHYVSLKVFGADSAAQLRGLSDAEFTAQLLSFWLPASGNDAPFASIRDLDISGAVRRGSDTTLVVYRWRYVGQNRFHIDRVQPMVRCGADWCAERIANFSGLLSMLRPPGEDGDAPACPVPRAKIEVSAAWTRHLVQTMIDA